MLNPPVARPRTGFEVLDDAQQCEDAHHEQCESQSCRRSATVSHCFCSFRTSTDDGFLAILHPSCYNLYMGPQTKTCQNCKSSFTIEPDDFGFYEKIKVPPPTWCPECRLMRRLLWRHGRMVYQNKCALCGAERFGIFHPSVPMPLYCPNCWWSDKWDPMKYGRDVDFSKPFFPQLFALRNVVPAALSWSSNSVNCKYCITEMDSKNCYFCFAPWRSEECYYCFGPLLSKNCVDSDLGKNMSNSYGNYNSDSIYKTQYANFSEECMNSAFLFNCTGCTDCFGGVNLQHKKYHLFNEPLTKERYLEKMRYWDLGSYARVKEAEEKFRALYYATPHRYAWIVNSPNSTGDNLKNSKNCQVCFATLDGVEDSKYIFLSGLMLKDSRDVNYGGMNSQLLYETTASEEAESVFFSKGGKVQRAIQYCDVCINSHDLFGCVSLRNKQYCILNKQYTKEEYEQLRDTLIAYMKTTGEYGEFFPIEYSPWKYNESFAYDQFPITKDEALAKGYGWRDEKERNYAITTKPDQLPDHIKDAPDSIVNEIIGCVHASGEANMCNEQCSTAFRIVPEELAFYRQMNIALPRLCPNCRFFQRIRYRTPPKLWHRKCMNQGCQNEFEIAYAPDRKEIIYCKDCYQAEFL